MAKSLSSFPEKERKAIAEKRVASNSKGLSYWAAVDFLREKKKKDAENS